MKKVGGASRDSNTGDAAHTEDDGGDRVQFGDVILQHH